MQNITLSIKYPLQTKKHPTPLTKAQQELANKYIAEEIATGAYSRAQAIAIGISRARKGKSRKK